MLLREGPLPYFRTRQKPLLLPLRELSPCSGLRICRLGNGGRERLPDCGWGLTRREHVKRCRSRFLCRLRVVVDVSARVTLQRNRFHVGVAWDSLNVCPTSAHLGAR